MGSAHVPVNYKAGPWARARQGRAARSNSSSGTTAAPWLSLWSVVMNCACVALAGSGLRLGPASGVAEGAGFDRCRKGSIQLPVSAPSVPTGHDAAAPVRAARLLLFMQHSGLGNQELALRLGLQLALASGRQLVVPPIMPHYMLAFGNYIGMDRTTACGQHNRLLLKQVQKECQEASEAAAVRLPHALGGAFWRLRLPGRLGYTLRVAWPRSDDRWVLAGSGQRGRTQRSVPCSSAASA